MRSILLIVLASIATGCGGGGGSSGKTMASIAIEPLPNLVGRGGTLQLKARANYAGGSAADVTTLASWSSDSPAIAKVSAGLVSGLEEGSALITVKLDGFSAQQEVLVKHYQRAFVTSVSGTGDLSTWADAGGKTGTAAADAVCQARAQAGGLPGTYRAWLSDSADDADCRVAGLSGLSPSCSDEGATFQSAEQRGPWLRMDGVPFILSVGARTWRKQVSLVPIGFDEYGRAAAGGRFWTGSSVDLDRGKSCSDWTVAANSSFGSSSEQYAVGTAFAAPNWEQCGTPNRLLCMEVGAAIPFTLSRAAGRIAFVTSTVGNGNLGSWADAGGESGVAAGDAICQAHAAAAGLANATRFKAWLSDETSSAIDRLTSNGPWVRVDGLPVAGSKAALASPPLFTGIALDEKGTHVESESSIVWTGTAGDGSSTGMMCSGWRDAAASLQATAGRARDAGAWTSLTMPGGVSCSLNNALYCFED